ncbi:MAG TPA: chemotaxis protein CheX [Paraburkholderia sp.]|jgi:CheY-specific phosphatase CheX|nr:chemotaxis protein CheX [Paraburkholderia sp.]
MNDTKPVSKVLVLDDDLLHADTIKRFCDENNLVGVKVRKSRLLSVLRANIDLGAILLHESYGGSLDEAAAIANRIYAVRPELPIIMRRERRATMDDLPESLRQILCAVYVASDITPLRDVIDKYIFSLDYPNALVRGISEISESMLTTLFKELTIASERPSIVRDRIIFGEVFSLIALESAWCRGYMMIQAEEEPLLALLDQRRSGSSSAASADFRDLNDLLGELTNMIWGAFKNRFLGEVDPTRAQVQVPLLVNHRQKYISFGSDNPQLCFVYELTDEQSGRSVKLHQRFVFSLSWSPEAFSEIAEQPGATVGAGELDLF